MTRQTGMLAALVFLLVVVTTGLSQDLRAPPGPDLSTTVLGSQLVAWSYLQKPEPVPQPRPAPLPDWQPQQQPNLRRYQYQSRTSADSQAQQLSGQTFMGTIVKESSDYVLRASDSTTYQVDDQQRVQQYANKRVKVVGTLDRDRNDKIIRIQGIGLAPPPSARQE
jgi:hypothetical protein